MLKYWLQIKMIEFFFLIQNIFYHIWINDISSNFQSIQNIKVPIIRIEMNWNLLQYSCLIKS